MSKAHLGLAIRLRAVASRLSPAAFMVCTMVFGILVLSCSPEGGRGGGAVLTDQVPSEPLKADDLSPVLREVGGRDRVPDRFVIELAMPARPEVAENDENEETNEDEQDRARGVDLSFEPSVKGKITWNGASSLVFTPTDGFRPATTYKVTLSALKTADGVIEPPTAGAWSRTFTTPEFRLLDVRAVSFDAKEHRAEVAVTFSGAFRSSDLPNKAWTMGGKAVAETAWREDERDHAVALALLTDLRLGPDSTVDFTLPPDVRSASASDHKAQGTVRSVKMTGEPAMRVLSVRRQEGASGWYLEVVCSDDSVGGYQRYWTDSQDYDWFEVSERCMLASDDAVRIDPPVEFSLTPGPAGFRILGNFPRGVYNVTIDAGARTLDGGRLGNGFTSGFSVPARSPRVSFLTKGRYLPRKAWKNLGISSLNLRSAKLELRQIRPENLVFWMSDTSEEATPRVSDLVLKSNLLFKLEPDRPVTSFVDVGTLIPDDAQGVYELAVSGKGSADHSRILLTNMNLVAKRAAKKPKEPWGSEIMAWVLDMDSTGPVQGVEIRLIRPSGFVLARCTTDRDGGCRIDVPIDTIDPTPPFALVATKGNDLTYLKFDELEDEVSEESVSGESFFLDTPYRASSYTDRGVYRPGDVAHFVAIVRDRESVAPPRDMPVLVKLVDPRGKVIKSESLRTNEAGILSTDWRFEAYAATGRYQVTIEAGKSSLGEYRFNVEEFVPERMKVTASSPLQGAMASEKVPIHVDAQYLFGGSASGSRFEITCQQVPALFTPPGLSNYTFGVFRQKEDAQRAFTLGTVGGELDADGEGTLECPALGEGRSLRGPARLDAKVAVFEGGSGRSTTAEVSLPAHPERFYLGLRSVAKKAEAGRSFNVDGVVVDWNGKPVASVASVKVDLFRLDAEYNWWWSDSDSDERFERMLRPVGDGTIPAVAVAGGHFQFTVTPSSDSEGYLVRVTAGNARTDLQLEGNGLYYWWSPEESRVDQTPRPMKPTPIAVHVPDSIRVGQMAKVTFDAPYKGRVLLTVETWHVLTSEWIDVGPGEQKWEFKVDEFVPNVYVSAFLVKDPHLDSAEAFLPDRAFGVASVKVEPEAFVQRVRLDLPKDVRSNATFVAHLDMGAVPAGTYATVAAVDEGILSLTRFRSPDPLSDIFLRRALGVESFETIGWTLLIPPMGSSSRTGGDESGLSGRVQPVRPVALWSGLLPVPENGRLDVRFDVPQYRGSLRVMAVVAGSKKVGSAWANVVVKDPIVLEATLPRFLSAGDEAQVPVLVTNLSGSTQKVTVAMHVENLPVAGVEIGSPDAAPVTFKGARETTVNLRDGATATAVFQVRALASTGAARFFVSAKAGNLESHEELDVPFEPAGPRGRKVSRIALDQGGTDLKPYLEGWVPTTETTTLWVTANPYGEVFDHLKSLIQYPYGCIEQTTSTTRPLLYLSNLLANVDPALLARESVEDRVMHGVNRILSMQTAQGGFAYWPGSDEPNYWGTAYATHLLLDAKRAGYDVPQSRIDEAIDWMDRLMASRVDENDAVHGEAFHYGQAYIHYVLALSGKGNAAAIAGLVDDLAKAKKPDDERAEQLFLLKAALYLAGDQRYAKDLRNPDVSPIKKDRRNDQAFYSDLRRRGFMLSILEDLFPKDPGQEKLATLVAAGLSENRNAWYSTQELVWGITGLGKRLSGYAATFSVPRLLVNGVERKPYTGPQDAVSSDRSWSVARLAEASEASLYIDQKTEGNVFLLLSSDGVRAREDFPYGGSGLSLRREYLDGNGNEIDVSAGSLSLGDMAYVRLSLTNTLNAPIHNLALVDRLPAGFEIENPRLGRGSIPDWVDADAAWEAQYMNLRDDRVEVFGTLESAQTRQVVYSVRAVTSGVFHGPPVEAEAMYNADIWARVAGSIVNIAGPWARFLL
jgi:alpha-2-macroglobulin